MFLRSLFLSIFIMLAFAPIWAGEEEKDKETLQATMVVTAEKREEQLADVPLSLSVVDARALETTGSENIKEVAYHVPNLYISEFAAKRTATPYIRGIGAGQGEPAVSTYIDGVPQLTVSSANMELLDLERIEVLRGPQGSLYGRNTIGGLVHLISREPDNQFRGNVHGEFGSHGHQRLRASVSGAISEDKAYYSVAASTFERDGFTENDITGNDIDFQDTTFARLQLMFTPNESWKIKISAHTQDDKDGGFLLYDRTAYEGNPFHLAHDWEGVTERDLSATSLSVTYRANSFDITSITSMDAVDALERTDLDFLPFDLLQRQTVEDHEQFYQELRFSSPQSVAMGSINLDWVAGLSYFSTEFFHDAYTEVRPAATGQPASLFLNEYYELDDSGLALFGQTTLGFGNNFDLTLGLRFESESKEWNINHSQVFGGFPLISTTGEDDDDYDEVLPRVGIAYRFSDTFMGFANASKSYRAGGYNRNTSTGFGEYDPQTYTYDSETSWSYEAGLKTSWLDDRVFLAATVFSMDWEDRQLSVPIPGVTGQYYLDNAAETTSQGIELELSALLNEYLTLQGGLGTNSAEFDDYLDPTSGQNVDGNSLPLVADRNWNLALNYNRQSGDFGYTMHAGVIGLGKIYYDAINSDGEDSVSMYNARIGFHWKGLHLEAWGKNLGDETYYHMAIPHTILEGSWAVKPANPKESGFTVGYKF